MRAPPSQVISFIVSFSVFVFFATMLSVPRGYTAGAALLLLTSFYYLGRGVAMRGTGGLVPSGGALHTFQLSREDKGLLWLFTAIWCAGLISFLYHSNTSRSLDLPSRYVLAVPVLLLLLAYRPCLKMLWGGLIAGVVSGAGVGLWQVQVRGDDRAFGFTGGIQFGDLSLMMGILCVAGLVWTASLSRHKRLWQAALLLGAAAGVCGSVASGTRGGWAALPVVALLFSLALVKRHNVLRATLALLSAGVALALIAGSVPIIKDRYVEGITDIQQYRAGHAETSLGMRFAMWEGAVTLIKEKPLLGWSDTGYRTRLEQVVAARHTNGASLVLNNLHNTYLEVWVLQGSVGLVAVLALLVSSFWFFCRRLRDKDAVIQAMALGGTTLVASYSIFSLTQIMLGRNNTLLFFVMALVVFWACLRHQERKI